MIIKFSQFYMNLLTGVLQKLATLKVAPGLSIFVGFRKGWHSNAEAGGGPFVLIVTAVIWNIITCTELLKSSYFGKRIRLQRSMNSISGGYFCDYYRQYNNNTMVGCYVERLNVEDWMLGSYSLGNSNTRTWTLKQKKRLNVEWVPTKKNPNVECNECRNYECRRLNVEWLNVEI